MMRDLYSTDGRRSTHRRPSASFFLDACTGNLLFPFIRSISNEKLFTAPKLSSGVTELIEPKVHVDSWFSGLASPIYIASPRRWVCRVVVLPYLFPCHDKRLPLQHGANFGQALSFEYFSFSFNNMYVMSRRAVNSHPS